MRPDNWVLVISIIEELMNGSGHNILIQNDKNCYTVFVFAWKQRSADSYSIWLVVTTYPKLFLKRFPVFMMSQSLLIWNCLATSKTSGLASIRTHVEDENLADMIAPWKDGVLAFALDQLEKFQPRDDYCELLKLAIIFLGGTLHRGFEEHDSGTLVPFTGLVGWREPFIPWKCGFFVSSMSH